MPRSGSPPPPGDTEGVDRLYQVALAEFIAARTALEKALRAAGQRDEAAAVHALGKPSLPAWAVNQVYWHDRRLFDAVVRTGDDLRTLQRQMLAGRAQDPRTPMQARQEAIRAAVTAAVARIADAGDPVTDATRQKIQTTFEAIASWGSAEAPFTHGRLDRDLALPGFEALAALAGSGPPSPLRLVKGTQREPGASKLPTTPSDPGAAKAATKAREAELRQERARRGADVRTARRELERAERAQSEAVAGEREAERQARSSERAAAKAADDLARAQRAAHDARARAEAAAKALEEARARRGDADAAVKVITERLASLTSNL